MPDDEITRIVSGSGDIREACKKLIQRANESGGEDNITAVLIKIEETGEIEADGVDTTAPPEAGEDGEEQTFAEEPTMPGVTPEIKRT